jgi:hypothetical protein
MVYILWNASLTEQQVTVKCVIHPQNLDRVKFDL